MCDAYNDKTYQRLQALRAEREALDAAVEAAEAEESNGREEQRAAFEARSALFAFDDSPDGRELTNLEHAAVQTPPEQIK